MGQFIYLFILDFSLLIVLFAVVYIEHIPEKEYFSSSIWSAIWPRQAKLCLRACAKCTDSDSSHACAKSHPGIAFHWQFSIVSNLLVDSKGPDQTAQSDQDLRCPHILKDTFSHSTAQIEFRFTPSCDKAGETMSPIVDGSGQRCI